MKKFVLVLVALVTVAVAWFLASPLFIDRKVDESPPEASIDLRPPSAHDVRDAGAVFPTREQVHAMTSEERAAAMAEAMDAAAAMPDKRMEEPMVSGGPGIVARGRFTDADAIHRGSGDALLYRLADGTHLVRFENFRVTNGPALYVYLVRHPQPARASDVEAGFVSLGRLKGNIGNQNYGIPAEVDIGDYRSVVIWCQLFGVLFSPAPLSPGPVASSLP